MNHTQWQESYKSLIKSITDGKDQDFVQCLLDEGLECEERAKELTQFIKDNNIDCRGCFDGNHERYLDYEKLLLKATEHWEVVNEWGDD